MYNTKHHIMKYGQLIPQEDEAVLDELNQIAMNLSNQSFMNISAAIEKYEKIKDAEYDRLIDNVSRLEEY